jgi:glycine/D-amino acid oxidase-like deaminating enzyme
MGTFILPRHDGVTKMGSTYVHTYADENPTESGKNQILSRTDRFFLPKFVVAGHEAGVRPATLDRRPFIGMHREKQNIVIFNGLGAKGVTLAPYFSEVLIDFLESGRELEKEVNVERFLK